MPKICANKCEESLKWADSFPDQAMVCMFCNGPLIYNTGQSLFENIIPQTKKVEANTPLVTDAHQLEQDNKVKQLGERDIEVRSTKRVTEKTYGIHEDSVAQPPIHEDSVAQPPIHEVSVAQPPIHEDSVAQPPIHEDSVAQPPIHEVSVAQPPIHDVSVARPPIQDDSVAQPPIHEDSVAQPPIHEDSATQLPIHEDSVAQPPVHEDYVAQPPVHEDSITQPPIHDVSVARPPIQDDSVAQPPIHEDSVAQPPIHEDSVAQPPIHEDSVAQPPIHEVSVAQPPIHDVSVARPPIQDDSVAQPPIHEDSVAQPPIHEDSATQPPIQKNARKFSVEGDGKEFSAEGSASNSTADQSPDIISSDLEPDNPDSIIVQFYTIVPMELWKTVDTICLRTGYDSFSRLYCRFTLLQEVKLVHLKQDFNFAIITGDLRIPSSLQFPYKYYFQMKEEGVYENLHHYAGSSFNRHFINEFPKGNSDIKNTTFRQFDLMILPELQKDKQSMFKRITSLFSNQKDCFKEFKDIYIRRYLSLQALLPKFLRFGCNPVSAGQNYLDEFLETFLTMVQKLSNLHISPLTYFNSPSKWDSNDKYTIKAREYMASNYISHMFQMNNRNIDEKLLCVYFAIILIYKFKLKDNNLVDKLTDEITGRLRDLPDSNNFAFEYIQNRDSLRTAMCEFISVYLLQSNQAKKFFQVLTFYHQIFRLTRTHIDLLEQLDYTTNEYWGFPARMKINRISFASKIIEEALELSHHDPILPYSIIYYSLELDCLELFTAFHSSHPTLLPLSAFVSLILIRLSDNNAEIYFTTKLIQYILSILTQPESIQKYPLRELERVFRLTSKLSSRLNPTRLSEVLFYLILELFAHLSTAIQSLIPENITPEDKQIISKFVNAWHNEKVLKVRMELFEYKNEMNFLNKVINYSFPDSLQWSNYFMERLESILKTRNIPLSMFTNLFIYVHDKLGESIKVIFRKEMIDRLKVSDANSRNDVMSQLKSLDPNQCASIDIIFMSILDHERDKFMANRLVHLLEWPSWGHYFELYSTKSGLFQHISDETKSLLDTALDTFLRLIKSICTYQIRIDDVTYLSDKRQRFISLAQLVLATNSEINHSIQEIGNAIQYCISATDWANIQLKRLKELEKLFNSITTFNCPIVQDFLAFNLPSEIVIAGFVEKQNDNFNFVNQPEINLIINSIHLQAICDSIQYLINSDIFSRTFNDKYLHSEVRGEKLFSFDSFFSQIWIPTINRVGIILSSCCDLSIRLFDVDRIFDKLRNYKEIFIELNNLSFGYHRAQVQTITSISKLPECGNSIALYFTIQDCYSAATKLLEVRDAFSIESKFQLIDDLRNFKHTLPNKPLSTIDSDFTYIVRTLIGFTNEHLRILDSILDKVEFINWVKHNMHDLNDLKTFVEIALSTSSGDDAETDRIMILHSVCTNFAPIIFYINKDTTYDYLIEKCIEIFKVVNTNTHLLGMLDHASKSISFWEELKRCQGSLEEGALMQLEKIVSSGIFHISTSESFDPMQMVSLTIEKVGSLKSYDMEQLRDLKSKLTLVVGKSDLIQSGIIIESHKNASEFNIIFELITELAIIISDLAEFGNMQYSNYTFSCSLLDSDRVRREIEQSRNRLTLWKLKLEESRNDRYYLNFYTISQLVLIQKGLRAFIGDSDSHDIEQLHHLLGLLNPDVSRDDIQTALRQSQINSCKSQTTPIAAVSFKPTRFHSVARSGHYSCIGGKTVSLMATKSKELVCEEEVQFPDNFTHSDRGIAEKIRSTCDFPLPLIIEGIKSIQRQSGVVTEHELIKWCMENVKMDSDTSSGDESNEDVSEERDDTSLPVHTHLTHTDSTLNTESEYIDMHQMGTFLEYIHHNSNTQIRGNRELYTIFKVQEPNLILVPSYLLYESVLSLYHTTPKLPLPFASEVLLCTELTKLEEIDIFWRRVISKSDYSHLYLFCLVGVDNLQYETAVQAVNLLRRYLQLEVKSKYKLVIICSEEGEERSYMAAALENYRRPSHVVSSNLNADISDYILSKLSQNISCNPRGSAWVVDSEWSRVRLVVSSSVGAGKTLYISNLDLRLSVLNEVERNAAVTVVIHGKQTSEEHLTEQLLKKDISRVEHGVIFHVDIASTVLLGIEPIMFKLLVLGYVCKGSGELWCCRGRDYYVIETTVDPRMKEFEKFTQLFPTVHCTQPIEALNTRLVTGKRQVQGFDETELNREDFQRTFAYLKQMEAGHSLDTFMYDRATFHRRSPLEILQVLLKYCGIERPSWTEMKNFVTFLSKQLSDCDNSYYCLSGVMGEEWVGFKSFVVKFLIYMSRDFATPSLRDDIDNITKDLIQVYEILKRRKWENSSHPYIFFNPDRQTMTFLGFLISDQGHLYYSENPTVVVEANILQPNLMKILQLNKVNLNEDYQLLDKASKIGKLAKVMEIEWLIDPDPDYVLTLDNMRKILAILMRFRCNIPVVVMGETGCGKTRLIQFMCALQAGANNLLILKVHGGTTERDVICKVEEAEELARENCYNHNIDTILFFDEANTSPAIGLIKEIMCDRRMYGRHISNNIRLQFIAACNPYRRHTKEMLHKLSTAGLGFFTKSTDTTDRLGDIPLRELVYRVMELPASMRPLVWDFGQLSNDIEKTYTREIVAKHLRDRNSPIEARDDVVDAISEILAGAQNYMRERKDECSFVSLRDVERAMRVMLWFYKMLNFIAPDFYPEEKEDVIIPHPTTGDTPSSLSSDISSLFVHTRTAPVPMIPTLHSSPVYPVRTGVPTHYTTDLDPSLRIINGIDRISYSLILAVAVCYRARLQIRIGFDRNIANRFKHPLTPIPNYSVIDKEIDRCQQNILEQMSVGEHIAKNKALKENVFMMFVCIELKIPLFVIGKPGSSKSLAKTIISNNMQGNKCQDGSILRNFKQVHIMSYQCSQLSTAEGIIDVFKKCRKMQRKTRSNRFVSCVVLDEVGLAEDSPHLPLKVLHPLLEDSSYGAEDANEISEFCPTTEYEPDESRNDMDREIGNSVDQVAFIGISNWSLDPAKMNRGIMVARGDPGQEELLSSANEICRSSSVDPALLESILVCIPSLAKAYLRLVKTTDTTREYYGLRDFYSLIKMLVFLCNEYKVRLNSLIFKHCVYRNFGGATDNQALILFSQAVKLSADAEEGPECSPLGLIRANLSSFSTSFYGETRYLLLLTENYSALNILLKSSDMWPDNKFDDIRVIFGSNFPRDQEYSTVCRNINKIKVCMETGKTVILLNLENLYESLYDALNQYYMKIYNQRYVDLGLGTHRMKCRVHENFKLIVIADKETVYSTFPTPLINRLEKHFLTMSTVLSENGQKISEQLTGWANKLSTLDKDRMFGFHRRGNFTVGDCFIGFHDDTPPSIVFHVMKEMYPDDSIPDTEVDTTAVLERCQTLLLRMATTDAVLRVKNSLLSLQSDNIIAEYFKLHLSSLEEYLRHVLSSTCNEMTGSHLTLATTHSRLLTDRDVDQLKQRLSTDTDTDRIEITSLSLQQFQTELQYTREIQRFLRGESGIEGRESSHKKILLIQCERGAENAKLIACARHKTVDELKDWREEKREFNFEVCLIFLIQLSREVHGSKFMSFCGGEWNTVHIDDIRSLDYKELPPVSELIGKRIYQLFEEERTVSLILEYLHTGSSISLFICH